MHFARLGLPDPAGRAPPCFTASSDLETRAGEISPTVFGFLAFAAGSSVVLASSVARLRFRGRAKVVGLEKGAEGGEYVVRVLYGGVPNPERRGGKRDPCSKREEGGVGKEKGGGVFFLLRGFACR